MARCNGSAAVALSEAMPQSAVRRDVARCAHRLAHAAQLAASAASGCHPLDGAEYLVDTIDDLSAALARLRRAVDPHA